jgi:hypothetical protein
MIGGGNASLNLNMSIPNDTKLLKPEHNSNKDAYIDINTGFKPVLEKRLEKAFEGSKCDDPSGLPCPIYLKSLLNL